MSRKTFKALVTAGALAAIALLSGSTGSNIPASVSAGTPQRPEFLGYNAYFGELHQHTGYSPDGCGLPEEALITAKSGRSNDFFAFTEHHNSFYFPEIGSVAKGCRIEQKDPHKWETLLRLAQQYTADGYFVALRGYEWTRDPGHINVYNSDTYNADMTAEDFYSWLAAQPQEVFAQFNHPLPFSWEDGMGDFEDFAFFPPVAAKIRIIENALVPPLHTSYPRALAREWQVSSVGYGDGHYANLAGSRRYGIFATELTRASVIDAIRNGRTFGNTQGNLAVALLGNGEWMGMPTTADRIEFRAFAADRIGDTILRIELATSEGVIDWCEPNANPAECSFIVDPVQPGDSFYLHAVDAGGEEAWSGSINRPLVSRIQSNPATLQFKFIGEGEAPKSQTFLLQSNDGADVPWRAVAHDPWVEVSPTEGEHLPAALTVTVAPAGLAQGLHTSIVTLETVDGLRPPIQQGIQVELGSVTIPTFSVLPRRIDLAAPYEAAVVSGTVTVSDSSGNLAWFAAPAEPWLTLSTSEGYGNGEIGFTANLQGRKPGAYAAHIAVTAGTLLRVTEIRIHIQPYRAQTLELQYKEGEYMGAADTYLDAWAPSAARGGEGRLLARSGPYQIPLVRFDLSQIPQNADVFTATLSLYAQEKSTVSALLFRVYEVLQEWDEATASWEERKTGIDWKAPGASKLCEDIACQPVTMLGTSSVGRWYDFDVTALARKWVARPDKNFGAAIVGESTANTGWTFASSQIIPYWGYWRPRFSIVYGEEPPTPTPTPTATPTQTPTSTPTPTATPSPTPSPVPRLYLPVILRG